MSRDMRCNDDIKGFITKWCHPDICDKDPDLVRISAGMPAKRYCPGRKINRCHPITTLHKRGDCFPVPATKFENTGRMRQPEGGGTSTPEPSATKVITIPWIIIRVHHDSRRYSFCFI